MRQNKKETTPATQKKRFGNRWLLALYDLLLLFMADVVLLVLYRGMEGLEPVDIVVQGITAAACIFFMRWFWKVYSQVWRYGGIQSYIRLLVSDGCAFLLYYLVEQFLPVRHISFARVLCISCLSLLGSLTIRMVYRYAYKCCDRNTVLGRILNVIVRMFAGNRIELDNNEQTNQIRVAIVGAGKVGVSLAEELLSNRTSAYVPKCFIDTDPEKRADRFRGFRLLPTMKWCMRHWSITASRRLSLHCRSCHPRKRKNCTKSTNLSVAKSRYMITRPCRRRVKPSATFENLMWKNCCSASRLW